MSTTDTRKRTTRVVTTRHGYLYELQDAPVAGEVYCLVEWVDLDPRPGAAPQYRYGTELTKNPRTNMDHTVLWEGWLGTTNGIDRSARGAYRVVSVTEWGEHPTTREPRWRVSLAPTAQPEED